MFPQPSTRVTRGHLCKIRKTHVIVNTDLRKIVLSKRCVNVWNSLSVHVVDATDVSSFKRGLDSAKPDLLFDCVKLGSALYVY